MKTNKELGAVYLEVDGLDKERFKELTNGMGIHPDYLDILLNTEYAYLENWYNRAHGYTWFPTDVIEPIAKKITLDELEQLLKPKKDMEIEDVVVISKEDYQRFVELESKEKNKPKFNLVYCMQSSGDWFKGTYKEWGSKENIKVLHNVFYHGVSYKLLVIEDSHIFLGKEI